MTFGQRRESGVQRALQAAPCPSSHALVLAAIRFSMQKSVVVAFASLALSCRLSSLAVSGELKALHVAAKAGHPQAIISLVLVPPQLLLSRKTATSHSGTRLRISGGQPT
jgi:hypothetical protein